MTSFKIFKKFMEDTGFIGIAFAFLVFLYFFMRRLDPAATVDGLGNLFLAVQMLLIGFAAASLAASICARLFGMPGREHTKNSMATGGWGSRVYLIMQRATWAFVFYLLFSFAVGR